MKFKLEFEIPTRELISINHSMLLLGSCFSQEIGLKFSEHKFDVQINPFGTIYNPYSIFRTIERSLDNSADYLFEYQGIFFDWEAHSDISENSLEKLKEKLKKVKQKTKEYLSNANWIIVTPGTSWIYKHKILDITVANCHKLPQQGFEKELLSKEDIVSQFEITNKKIQGINNDIKWLFTISPVRHIKDGLIENNRSKAHLLSAFHEIIDYNDNCYYFPSYEIMIDELRDYRYYKEDLIHPTQQAITYIWEKFILSYLDSETKNIIDEWSKIRRSLAHQPFNPYSYKHQCFLKEMISSLNKMKEKIDVKDEIEALKQQLI